MGIIRFKNIIKKYLTRLKWQCAGSLAVVVGQSGMLSLDSYSLLDFWAIPISHHIEYMCYFSISQPSDNLQPTPPDLPLLAPTHNFFFIICNHINVYASCWYNSRYIYFYTYWMWETVSHVPVKYTCSTLLDT